MLVGATVIWLLVMGRNRFLWFPLHPLGFLAAPTFPIRNMWFPIFLGWLVKTLVMKYGGTDTYVKVRPFMIGLILGNIIAMVFWMLVGFVTGTQIEYWTG